MSQGPVPFLYCDLYKRAHSEKTVWAVITSVTTRRTHWYNWHISSKFSIQIDFHLLKQILSLNINSEIDFWLHGRHVEKRYEVITLTLIVLLLRNLASRCKMTCRWRYTRENRNRKWNSNMSANTTTRRRWSVLCNRKMRGFLQIRRICIRKQNR